jgi:hypothetical protein
MKLQRGSTIMHLKISRFVSGRILTTVFIVLQFLQLRRSRQIREEISFLFVPTNLAVQSDAKPTPTSATIKKSTTAPGVAAAWR